MYIPPGSSQPGRDAPETGRLLFCILCTDMRTRVYVDGFNLYYGALKGTPYKWLDLAQLCKLLLSPKNHVDRIYYCTARVSARDGDVGQPRRQEVYLRALRTIPNLSIVEGAFLSTQTKMRLVTPLPNGARFAKVIKTEEKGSDVNLASLMLRDAYLDRFDVAVLISNDSDLSLPLQIVRGEIGKMVGILNPHKRPSLELNKHRDFYKRIRSGVLKQSQFAPVLTDSNGAITKPKRW